ncbi:MAG TPA: GerW family sporulation protein [Clostridia bacterium]|nr:GerW family sporulation protein [Clostridia bacterium]
MSDHPIEGMMNTTLEKIKQMVDINSIVGDPITSPDGSIIIPVSKISYGFASGGSDFPSKVQTEKEFFGGGTGAGVSINPVAFITICNGSVKLLQIDPYNSTADRIIGMFPEVVDKISDFVSSKKGENKKSRAEKKDDFKSSDRTGDVKLEDPQI